MDDAHFLICDTKISTAQQIIPALEICSKERIKLVIIAENIEGDALTTLVLNKLRGLPVTAVKAPGFGDNRKNMLQDIAILTGAEVLSEDLGLKVEKIDFNQLGKSKRVEISNDDTIILDGAGEKADIESRCSFIRDSLATASSEYDKEKLRERLAKLSGGVAVIKVGGASEVEVNEKKDRINDALNATRAAVEEGIVPGGGVTLLYASKILDNIKLDNFDQMRGLQILKNALKVPCQTIADNAGVEGALIVGKLLEQKDIEYGYNAQTGEYMNMFKGGVVDPTKVVRTAAHCSC
jgi:chaperonin GroEL